MSQSILIKKDTTVFSSKEVVVGELCVVTDELDNELVVEPETFVVDDCAVLEPETDVVEPEPDADVVESELDADVVESEPDADVVEPEPDADVVESEDTDVVESEPDAVVVLLWKFSSSFLNIRLIIIITIIKSIMIFIIII